MMLLLAAGPDTGDMVKIVIKLLIALLIVGLIYWIINRPGLPIPAPLRNILNVLLVVLAVLGIIVWLLLPLVS